MAAARVGTKCGEKSSLPMARPKLVLLLGAVLLLAGLSSGAPGQQNATEVKQPVANAAAPEKNPAKPEYLLPRHVFPIKYTITLTPDLEEFNFEGKVDVLLDVTEPANNITLHANGLNIKSLELEDTFGSQRNVKYSYNKTTNFLVVKSKDRLPIGMMTLKITYSGEIREELAGFYRSSYVNANNEKKWLATTQFEPVHARRAFPCLDEPFFKARFAITIMHDKKYTAISNTRAKPAITIPDSGLAKTVFEETKEMSSYLIAFVISDFANNSEVLGNKTYSVLSKPPSIADTEYALKSGERILQELEKFTKIDFPYLKMDQIAIPDFSAGAMENWGLVTYRERRLLVNNKTPTIDKQNVFIVIAHEFAHQWFGDLVSPKWWQYTWLNEGFATFFEYFIAHELEKDWRIVEQQVVRDTQSTAFVVDSKKDSHPINQNVYTPDEIHGVFDEISYQKGGSIIRMMQHFLGTDAFRNWLGDYLHKNEYKNTNSDDLFNAYKPTIQVNATKAQKSLKEIMDGWVNQKGYPVVEVKRNNAALTLTQKRFLSDDDEEEKVKDEHDYQWYIPITIVTNSSSFGKTTPDAWLVPNNNLTAHTVTPKESPWFIVNSQLSGYYRVNYEEQNWKEIAKHLKETTTHNSSKVHALNRAQVIDDATAFVKKGILKFNMLEELMEFLVEDRDYIPWFPARRTLIWLKKLTLNTEHHEPFQKYVISHYKSIKEELEAIKSANETKRTHIQNLTLSANTEFLCTFNDNSCLNEATEAFNLWLNGTDPNPNLKDTYRCHALKKADMNAWNTTLNIMLNTTDKDEKSLLVFQLACSVKKDILHQYINLSLTSQDKILNDTHTILRNIVQNSEVGVDVALEFLEKRLVALLIKNNKVAKLKELVNLISERVTNKGQFEKLSQIANHPDLPQTVTKNVLKAAEKRIKLLDNNKAELSNWIGSPPKPNPNAAGTDFVSKSTLFTSLLIVIATFSVIFS